MGPYGKESYLDLVVKEGSLSGGSCSETWMIRKHKPSDEKFPSAATTTSIHLMNSALLPGAIDELPLLVCLTCQLDSILFPTQGNHTAIISLLYCKIKISLSNGSFPLIHKHIAWFFSILKKYSHCPSPVTISIIRSFLLEISYNLSSLSLPLHF